MSFGPMTIARHREIARQGVDLRVLFNGEDVTDRCQFADDTPGQQHAILFKLNAQGQKYVEGHEAALEIVWGTIEFVPVDRVH